MKNHINTDIVILGGGLSGLSAAQQANKQGLDWVLLEKSPQVGGLTRSIYLGDYIFDYTGHFLHLSKFSSPSKIHPSIDDNEWNQIAKNAKCYFDGEIIDAPFQYNVGQLKENIRSKIYLEFINFKNNDNISSFRDYLVSNFGPTIAKEFLIPYNEKLLATDLDRISKDAVSRFFPKPNKNSILENISGEKSASLKQYNSKFWYPKDDGIQKLTNGLKNNLETNRLLVNKQIEYIDIEKKLIKTSDGYTIKYQKVISSIPFNILIKNSSLHEKYNDYTKNDITAATVLSFHIGVRGKVIDKFKDIHWIYFSENKYPFYRVGFYSNFNQVMAPKDTYSMYVEVGLDNKSIDLNKIKTSVIQSLEQLSLLKKNNIDIIISNFMVDGYVHYTFERQLVINEVKDILTQNNFKLIGRYGKWQYSSMEDSIIEGIDAINNISST